MSKITTSKSEVRRCASEVRISKTKESISGSQPKVQTNPEFLFFDSLKNIFEEPLYKTIIKLLHLYNEGVLNHSEFIELSQPYFSKHIELFDCLKKLTYSKMMNRRHYSILNKPLAEMDFSKCQRICDSYFELPRSYPNLICSGRTEDIKQLPLNDKFITIPTGSEDDKNPMKKNHYEENLFKFEDQRYEIDMIIEILKTAIEGLTALNDKISSMSIVQGLPSALNLEEELGTSIIRFITRFYKEYGSQIIQGILCHPKDTIPIVISRFKKRMEESLNQKHEAEKTIKMSFDRFYFKSFDYRSFKFKNYDKKNNNAKAFLKEISNRKKDRQSSMNVNILKGGSENFEFFTSLNFKFLKENVNRIIRLANNEEVLLKNNEIFQEQQKKKLPDMRLIFDNLEIFKISLSVIYYQIFISLNIDCTKVAECLSSLLFHLFGLDMSQLMAKLSGRNSQANDKNLNYSEIIENIKNKTQIDQKEIDKYYGIDKLAKSINHINEELNVKGAAKGLKEIKDTKEGNPQVRKDSNEDSKSEISLTPSLQSQDTGKTFKDVIIQDETFSEKNIIGVLFYPPKENNILLYSNENWFVLLRFLFCIYERFNKLNEYSILSEANYLSQQTGTPFPINPLIFKNFIIIYKALLHKKFENTTVYEELCRDILGNESYFLFNLDKLINSVRNIFYLTHTSKLIKTVSLILNDYMSKEILSLFKFETSRKNAVNEKLYFSNFLQLLDSNAGSNFRILFSPKLHIMTIHLMELPAESNRKDYYDSFKEFMENVLQESYVNLYQENQSTDDPFNIFLNRNKNKVTNCRDCLKPAYCENSLIFRFDYATKKIQFLKSGADVLIFNKTTNLSKSKKLQVILNKNLSFRLWNEVKL